MTQHEPNPSLEPENTPENPEEVLSSVEPLTEVGVDDDQIKISLLAQELERTKDQLMRALAETENTRKRALREREDAAKFAISGFSRDLLSVADNLRRALMAVPPALAENFPEVKNLLDGIEVTEREMLRTFEKNGIQKLEPLDDKYDPHLHEVMFEAPIPGKINGVVIQVIEPGYTLHGRVLRPARVGISKNDSDTSHIVDTQA